MKFEDDPVAEHYECWPYPPVGGDTAAFTHYLRVYETLRNFAPRFWPAGKPREKMNILVAGCGTVAAACHAYDYPECQVVGIDLSRASLEEEEKLKDRYHLQNLILHHCPIEEVDRLGITFDYISCQGVLHHVRQPVDALRVLGRVLEKEGIIRLALYGKYPRAQVYAFQQFFRLLDLDQSPESVAFVRQTLAGLPPDHPLQDYLRQARDQHTDAGLVDTFLHRRDRAYTVSDCLALVAEAGLVFQGWDMNFDYHPDGPLRAQEALRERLSALPEKESWQAMEILSGSMRMHEFHVCRPDRDPATYRIPWDSDALLAWIPGHCVDLVPTGGTQAAPTWAMGRNCLPLVPLTTFQAAIFSRMDGKRSVRECLAAAGISGNDQQLLAAARPLLRLLWRTGYGVLCLSGATY